MKSVSNISAQHCAI